MEVSRAGILFFRILLLLKKFYIIFNIINIIFEKI